MLKSKAVPVLISSCFVLLAGCGPNGAPEQPAAGPDAPAVPSDGYDIDQLVAAAAPGQGRMQFILCQSCHSVEEGGVNKVGPNLWGVFGREAAQVPGFNYSPALQASAVVWDNETMDAFLRRPNDLVPGTTMVFQGMNRVEDRARLIAWLRAETGAD